MRTIDLSYTLQACRTNVKTRLSLLAGDRGKMSYANLLYHIVFGTKGRFPFIADELKPHLHAYLGGTVRGLGGTAFEINGMNDHVHLLVKLNTTHRVDYFLRDLKANSSKWAKVKTNGKFGWQRRYGAFTVSESQFSVVQIYSQSGRTSR